jgi:hypothetical protein
MPAAAATSSPRGQACKVPAPRGQARKLIPHYLLAELPIPASTAPFVRPGTFPNHLPAYKPIDRAMLNLPANLWKPGFPWPGQIQLANWIQQPRCQPTSLRPPRDDRNCLAPDPPGCHPHPHDARRARGSDSTQEWKIQQAENAPVSPGGPPPGENVHGNEIRLKGCQKRGR